MENVIFFFLNIVTGYLCLPFAILFVCNDTAKTAPFSFFYFFIFWNNVLIYI